MRVFIIARGIPTIENAQWGCFERDQADALASAGHDVTILSIRQRPFFKYFGIRINRGNFNTVSVSLFPGMIFGNHGAKIRVKVESQALLFAYKKAVKLFGEPDVLYSHYLYMSDLATVLKEKFNKPLVGIEHWSACNRENLDCLVKEMGRRTYQRLDGLITVSDQLQERILKHFGINSVVVHNMISKEFGYTPIERNDIFTMTSVGSLLPIKGFDILIQALCKINLPRESWQVNIVGDGPERVNLQKCIDEAGLTKNIHLLGLKNKSEVLYFLQHSDCFILPSRSENFSVAVLEAQACGVPVIASICGGIKECVNNSNGLLFPVEDVFMLKDCIEKMYVRYRFYSREKISETCLNRFSPQIIARKIEEVFLCAINQNNQS